MIYKAEGRGQKQKTLMIYKAEGRGQKAEAKKL
jgi:hypothetical protein